MDKPALDFGPPPGPGSWELDTAHFVRPLTRFVAEVLPRAMDRGLRVGLERFGVLLSHFDIIERHGFVFTKPVPFGAPPNASGPPPKLVLMAMTRLLPSLRRRIRTGQLAFEQRIWREDLRAWDEESRPRAIEKHRAIQRVDPATLDDDALARHIGTCRDHLAEMIAQHHRFTVPATAPIGDFLAHVTGWTGRSVGELLAALKGSSPVSLGVAAQELDALAEAVRADAATRELLASDRAPAEIVAALRDAPGEIGSRARAYLDVVGYRSLGYDLGDPFALELPEVLVRALRASVEKQSHGRPGTAPDRIDALRAAVPEAHRARFDELLAEARFVNRLRDERGHFSDAWACGLARRAMLEAGARMVARGSLDDASLMVDASADEAAALLRGQPGPDATTLSSRRAHREKYTVADAPSYLGAAPTPPPPVDWLPSHGRRAVRAVDAFLGVIAEVHRGASVAPGPATIAGLGVSAGTFEGRARVVLDPRDFTRIEKGDVLVARSTSPYFNVVLPLLGAIVTDRGGQLSHAAIVAREYGIPGVVGTGVASEQIPDGARVRVDGTTGEVQVLGR